MIRFDNIIQATATYEKANRIMYATVNSVFAPLLVPFSTGDDVLILVTGASVLAEVGAFETSGDGSILQITGFDIDHNWLNSFFNSGSEREVLLKGLYKSKPQVNPYATINVPTANERIILELKRKIASTNGVDFSEAAGILGLDTSSQAQAGIIFNEGNPKITAETVWADKVKAFFSTKGMVIFPAKTKGQIYTDSGSVQRLDDYLKEMREVFLMRDEQKLVQFTITVVDEQLNVIANNKPIKNVCVFKKDGNKEYRIIFHDDFDKSVALSGSFTIIIERKTVERFGALAWYGETLQGAFIGRYLIWSDQVPNAAVFNDVTYSKRYGPATAAGLELDLISPWFFRRIGELASFTVNKKTIYGVIKLDEDNKVKIIKPANVSVLAWARDLAALKSSGTGFLAQVKKGSLAKDEMLQLRVDLGNVVDAFDVLKGIQDIIPAATVGQLIPFLGKFKVKDAELSLAKAEVKALTAITNLTKENIELYKEDNYFEITVPPNSKETFNVVNSNGGVDRFREVGIDMFLDATVLELKENYENVLQSILSTPGATVGDIEVIWTVDFQVMGVRFPVVNAEVIQTTSGGKTYRLFYDQPGRFLFYDQVISPGIFSDCVQVMFARTESQQAF